MKLIQELLELHEAKGSDVIKKAADAGLKIVKITSADKDNLEGKTGFTHKVVLSSIHTSGYGNPADYGDKSSLTATLKKMGAADADVCGYGVYLKLNEAKGEYNSFKSWKAAIKKKHPDAWIEGDEDIAQAMVGPKPFKQGETKSVGEWDGAKGELYEAADMQRGRNAAEAGRGPSARDVNDQPGFFKKYKDIAVKHGWKQRADHLHHPLHGTIEVNRHGEWTHLPHGSLRDADDGFGGSNELNFEKHLKSLQKNEGLNEDKTKMMIMRDYRPVLTSHGFKLQAGGSWYKTTGCGIIKIDKHGHWEHTDVGESEGGREYEGTTHRTLDRHLTSLGM